MLRVWSQDKFDHYRGRLTMLLRERSTLVAEFSVYYFGHTLSSFECQTFSVYGVETYNEEISRFLIRCMSILSGRFSVEIAGNPDLID